MSLIKGLSEELTTQDGGKPFAVDTLQCPKCGTTTNYATGQTRCEQCGSPLRRDAKRARTITPDQTKKIIDQKLVYKCPECLKCYDTPQLCCNAEFVSKKTAYFGYMCLGCNTIYDKQVTCCSGSMLIQGKVYPEPTMQELKLVHAGLSVPLTGVMQ